ncbi:hypothetical protein [Alicyclobacillus fastidiosus]|uniref:Phage protein n=1 Tax=Alicyclobacillus fastidiosus TaxID=392011 RepID=A0ABV5AKU0_9BACL|nr:hypothetical protein [Alicyclobacillus fastidiosus]WEH10263.1 hypothetical protein PYS47_03245 [Alicyclobacillus fastidiosus]
MHDNEVIYHRDKNGYRYIVVVQQVQEAEYIATTSISALVPLTVSPAVPMAKERTFGTRNEALAYATVLWEQLKEENGLD